MKGKKKVVVLFTGIIILCLAIFYNYDYIYIEIGKHYMFEKGEVSDHYVKFVMEKKGEMKIHEIAKYGEKRNKTAVSLKLYEKTVKYYIDRKASTETIEMFCSRIEKDKYSAARQIGYREVLIRKKEELKREFLKKESSEEEKFKKIEALLRYVMATDEPEKNVDIIQDIASIITDKKQIYAIYSYLVNFYMGGKNPYKEDVLKMMESDLAGRLTQQEIDRVFRRK